MEKNINDSDNGYIHIVGYLIILEYVNALNYIKNIIVLYKLTHCSENRTFRSEKYDS